VLGDDYTLHVAPNGKVALKIAEMRPQPDLILLGIMMQDNETGMHVVRMSDHSRMIAESLEASPVRPVASCS
jgi:CheY-like chemotaxis protein